MPIIQAVRTWWAARDSCGLVTLSIIILGVATVYLAIAMAQELSKLRARGMFGAYERGAHFVVLYQRCTGVLPAGETRRVQFQSGRDLQTCEEIAALRQAELAGSAAWDKAHR